jgi:hypothetical protein
MFKCFVLKETCLRGVEMADCWSAITLSGITETRQLGLAFIKASSVRQSSFLSTP